ncbi:hypothetical protein LC087_12735 [Bacillus carboniphilus]|uniref:Uncharacterized protein n=1 Tax=Bacillus carboniphilus TaxID=86663 RepID=A0ABY9JQQ1_9BACI|nr:hypothetical protein [Bacillus carboniphilus]WLR41725.1 hypothetical protein LC087_12735 [Bacillus carboniphilus]
MKKIFPDLPESKWSTVPSKMHTLIGDDGNKNFRNVPEQMKRVKDVKNLALNAGKSFTYGPGIGVAADAGVYAYNNGNLEGFDWISSSVNNGAVTVIGAGVGVGIGVGYSFVNSQTGWSFSKALGIEKD